jgi:hypothetical protein
MGGKSSRSKTAVLVEGALMDEETETQYRMLESMSDNDQVFLVMAFGRSKINTSGSIECVYSTRELAKQHIFNMNNAEFSDDCKFGLTERSVLGLRLDLKEKKIECQFANVQGPHVFCTPYPHQF